MLRLQVNTSQMASWSHLQWRERLGFGTLQCW